eukprot:TRINITY_DN1136_c0_g1_i1.p1 TRINITY_DN1136_c0_g1~~TRINITY_DN1136_c0_g1_i1.p1  ORF type:complete len:560 (-),score=131.98 TRINITY_DN1136_c0_g1_i1:40-1719(-)
MNNDLGIGFYEEQYQLIPQRKKITSQKGWTTINTQYRREKTLKEKLMCYGCLIFLLFPLIIGIFSLLMSKDQSNYVCPRGYRYGGYSCIRCIYPAYSSCCEATECLQPKFVLFSALKVPFLKCTNSSNYCSSALPSSASLTKIATMYCRNFLNENHSPFHDMGIAVDNFPFSNPIDMDSIYYFEAEDSLFQNSLMPQIYHQDALYTVAFNCYDFCSKNVLSAEKKIVLQNHQIVTKFQLFDEYFDTTTGRCIATDYEDHEYGDGFSLVKKEKRFIRIYENSLTKNNNNMPIIIVSGGFWNELETAMTYSAFCRSMLKQGIACYIIQIPPCDESLEVNAFSQSTYFFQAFVQISYGYDFGTERKKLNIFCADSAADIVFRTLLNKELLESEFTLTNLPINKLLIFNGQLSPELYCSAIPDSDSIPFNQLIPNIKKAFGTIDCSDIYYKNIPISFLRSGVDFEKIKHINGISTVFINTKKDFWLTRAQIENFKETMTHKGLTSFQQYLLDDYTFKSVSSNFVPESPYQDILKEHYEMIEYFDLDEGNFNPLVSLLKNLLFS